MGKLLASLSQQKDIRMNGYRPEGIEGIAPLAAAADFRRIVEAGGDCTGIISQQRALSRWGKDLPVALYLDPAREGGLEHRVWPAGQDILKVTWVSRIRRVAIFDARPANFVLIGETPVPFDLIPVSLDEIGLL